MKKLFIAALLTVIAGIMIVPVMASDVSSAEYVSVVHITNSGTALTNEVVVFDLSTADMIAGKMLNATASDAALLTGTGGSDIAFGYNNASKWCSFVSSIGATSNIFQYLYTGGATGGKQSYFPISPGMTTPDLAAFEPTNNFNLALTDTFIDAAVSDNIVNKANALYWGVSGGTMTANIYNAPASSYNYAGTETGTNWTNLSYINDNNMSTQTQITAPKVNAATSTLTTPALNCSKVKVKVYADDGEYTVNISWLVEIYYSAAWHTIHSASITSDIEYEISVSGSPTVSAIRLTPGTNPNHAAIYEVQAYQTVSAVGATVSEAITSGEHDYNLIADTSNLILQIDGVTVDSVALSGASVQNNAAAWYVGSDATLYIGSFSITTGGVLRDTWEASYAATFTGSPGGNVMTPTFRTTSTDPDLTAVIDSQSSTGSQSTPAAGSSGGWNMITATPAAPSNLYAEGATKYPLASAVSQAGTNMGQDPTSWVIVFALATVVLIIIVVYKGTQKAKMGQKGSLLLSALGGELLLIYFVAIKTLPGWSLIPLGLISIAFIAWRKSPAPLD